MNKDEIVLYVISKLKHLAGQHNQKRHGWRFGNLDKIRASMRRTPEEVERDEYRKRAGLPAITRPPHTVIPLKPQPPAPAPKKARAKKKVEVEKKPAEVEFDPSQVDTTGMNRVQAVRARLEAAAADFEKRNPIRKPDQRVIDRNESRISSLWDQERADTQMSSDRKKELISERKKLIKDVYEEQLSGSNDRYNMVINEMNTLANTLNTQYRFIAGDYEKQKRRDELLERYSALTDMKAKEDNSRNQTFLRAMQVDDPVDIEFFGNMTGALRKDVGVFADDLRKIISKKVFRHLINDETVPVSVKRISKLRSQYNSVRKLIELGPHTGFRTFSHEFGHHLEHNGVSANQSKRMSWASNEFRSRRAVGERQTQISPGEFGYKDNFLEHYMGKVYGYGNAGTEIISMGLQYLAHNPVKLMREDPDYFDFMIGVLQGD